MDRIFQILLPVVTGIVGWFGANVKSPRTNKQTDLQIINESIQPLLKSIKGLTEHNLNLTRDLVEEQKKTLSLMEEKRSWLAERGDLVDKVEKLGRQVATLTKEVKMLRTEREPGASLESDSKHE